MDPWFIGSYKRAWCICGTGVFRLNGFSVPTTPCLNSCCRNTIKQYIYIYIFRKEGNSWYWNGWFLLQRPSGKLGILDWLTGEKNLWRLETVLGKKICAKKLDLQYWGHEGWQKVLQGSLPLPPMTPESLGMMKMNFFNLLSQSSCMWKWTWD